MTDVPLREYWRVGEVVRRTTLSRSTLDRRIAAGEFPPARSLGGGTIAWWAADVVAWMEARDALKPTRNSGTRPGQMAGTRPETADLTTA